MIYPYFVLNLQEAQRAAAEQTFPRLSALVHVAAEGVFPPEVVSALPKGNSWLDRLKLYLLAIQQALPPGSTSAALNADAWRAAVQQSEGPIDLRRCLGELEASISPDVLSGAYRRQPLLVQGAWGLRNAGADAAPGVAPTAAVAASQAASLKPAAGYNGNQHSSGSGRGDLNRQVDGQRRDEPLAWLPATTAAVGLRILALDAAIAYRNGSCMRDEAVSYAYIQRLAAGPAVGEAAITSAADAGPVVLDLLAPPATIAQSELPVGSGGSARGARLFPLPPARLLARRSAFQLPVVQFHTELKEEEQQRKQAAKEGRPQVAGEAAAEAGKAGSKQKKAAGAADGKAATQRGAKGGVPKTTTPCTSSAKAAKAAKKRVVADESSSDSERGYKGSRRPSAPPSAKGKAKAKAPAAIYADSSAADMDTSDLSEDDSSYDGRGGAARRLDSDGESVSNGSEYSIESEEPSEDMSDSEGEASSDSDAELPSRRSGRGNKARPAPTRASARLRRESTDDDESEEEDEDFRPAKRAKVGSAGRTRAAAAAGPRPGARKVTMAFSSEEDDDMADFKPRSTGRLKLKPKASAASTATASTSKGMKAFSSDEEEDEEPSVARRKPKGFPVAPPPRSTNASRAPLPAAAGVRPPAPARAPLKPLKPLYWSKPVNKHSAFCDLESDDDLLLPAGPRQAKPLASQPPARAPPAAATRPSALTRPAALPRPAAASNDRHAARDKGNPTGARLAPSKAGAAAKSAAGGRQVGQRRTNLVSDDDSDGVAPPPSRTKPARAIVIADSEDDDEEMPAVKRPAAKPAAGPSQPLSQLPSEDSGSEEEYSDTSEEDSADEESDISDEQDE